MSWANPIVLWGLLGPALAAAMLLILALARRHRRWSRWPGVTRVVAVGSHVRAVGVARGTRRPWLLLLALAAALLALAGPRWGTVEEPVYQKSREVMLALDLSRSMLTQDVPPSRLERAHLLVRSLLGGLRGERVGLVIFAGTAYVQVPMSADTQILEEFLPSLKPEYMPQGGTDYDGMLRAALGGFGSGSDTDRYLIVLSDGEAASDAWRARLPSLKERGVRVIALGIGTTAGGFIPDARTGAWVKDARGAVVLSRLEPATLQALAFETGGAYRDASAWVDLAALLRETVERGRQGAVAERREARAIERFQWFLAPALLLALLGVWREIPARPRARQVRRATATAARATAAAALVLALAWPAPSRAAYAGTQETDGAGLLRGTVTRLAAAPRVSAAGWKAMAEQTLTLAGELTANQQPIPPGLVHDALEAVDRGEALDPRAADWPRLREQLQLLLEPPPEQEQQQQQDEQDQDQEQSSESQQPQQSEEQEQSPSGGSDPSQSQPQDDSQESQGQPQDQQQSDGSDSGQPDPKKQQQQQQPALGELKGPEDAADEPQPSSPPEAPKQSFGGGQPATPPPTDPQLAAALARLRELAERDQPAIIHQRIQEQPPTPPANARDW